MIAIAASMPWSAGVLLATTACQVLRTLTAMKGSAATTVIATFAGALRYA